MEHILKCHEIIKTDFVCGDNCTLYDQNGKQYIDFESGIWSSAIGHCHPRINKVIKEQIAKIIHLGTRYPHFLSEETAKELLKISGFHTGKCVFLSSGSEAVEFAVQIAKCISEKPVCFSFVNSYLAAYGSAGKKEADEWILSDWNDSLDMISFDNIGIFVFEPGGSGPGFVKFPPKEIVETIFHQIKRNNGLLVVNEVTTGIGRTGKWFGFQHYDIQPDIVAMGKGLGNGYPVSSVAMNQDVADRLENSGFVYAQSHQNDPLGCIVAKEVIATIQEEELIQRGQAVGDYFLEKLKSLEKKHHIIKEVRGRGLLLAIEFHIHKDITATFVYQQLLQHGFLVGYYQAGNIIRLDPSLTIDTKDIDRFIECIDSILAMCG